MIKNQRLWQNIKKNYEVVKKTAMVILTGWIWEQVGKLQFKTRNLQNVNRFLC